MKYLFIICSYFITVNVMAQDQKTIIRTIEVTGSHKMMIQPEVVIFNINIEEYWAEEFEGKKWEEYKTKISIDSIESELMAELKEMDISMSQITLNQAGNFWRSRGKDFLVNKNLEIKLESFEMANDLSNRLVTRGIKSMNIAKLDHSKIEEFKILVKQEALKNAQNKAKELLEVYGKEIGEVISIVEVDKFTGIIPMPQAGLRAQSMSMESSASVQYENFKMIELSEDIRVLFEIK